MSNPNKPKCVCGAPQFGNSQRCMRGHVFLQPDCKTPFGVVMESSPMSNPKIEPISDEELSAFRTYLECFPKTDQGGWVKVETTNMVLARLDAAEARAADLEKQKDFANAVASVAETNNIATKAELKVAEASLAACVEFIKEHMDEHVSHEHINTVLCSSCKAKSLLASLPTRAKLIADVVAAARAWRLDNHGMPNREEFQNVRALCMAIDALDKKALDAKEEG